MEKRIRVVWILSLVSVLVLVGVQAYWLYNQYQLVLDEYSEELAGKILAVGEHEYNLRKSEKKKDFSVMVTTQSEYIEENGKPSSDSKFYLSFVYNDSLPNDLTKQEKVLNLLTQLDTIQKGNNVENLLENDTISQMKLFFNRRLSQDSIQLLANMAITNMYNPFRTEKLDSLLRVDILGYDFMLSEWPASDTIYTNRWKQTGNIFHPRLKVNYTYSPFEKKGIIIDTDIPAQPLFSRMAVQLLLAFGIVMLLMVCLIFQIQTILKQKKINELRKSFVNTMIHELKRPVQTLKTFIAFLGDKDMRSDEIITEQVVQDSMFELDNLSAYLGKLKDMVRADTEETLLNLQRFDLRELTDKVIRLIQLPADKKVEFTRFFDMDSSIIEADPIHLANVLSNLIENAIKYSGDTVQIEIKAKRKGNELCLTVSDNGIGISTVEQERVFAKFYRGSNLPDQNIPGLGLGLSYVKLISEAHQGRVSLQSHLGEGTSVTLILPQ